MNDKIILNVTKRDGGLEVTTRGTGHDQLAAIEAVAATAWRVMTANRNVPPDAATGVILLSVQRGIQTAAGKSGPDRVCVQHGGSVRPLGADGMDPGRAGRLPEGAPAQILVFDEKPRPIPGTGPGGPPPPCGKFLVRVHGGQ